MNKTPSSSIEPNQKLRDLEQEKAQAEHRSQRLQNRERYLTEGARKKRTHHLCNMGGAIEALCPQIAALNKADFYRVMGAVSKWLKLAMRGSAFFRSIFGQAKTECRKNGTQGIIFIRNFQVE